MTSSHSPVLFPGKHRAAGMIWVAAYFLLVLPVWAQEGGGATVAPKKIVIPSAIQVVFSHTGIHTHANFLLFDTGTVDLVAMQRDPKQYPHLTFRAHSSLPTDRAALPPDLAAYRSPSDPPLENPYGPIDGGHGKPGWSLLPLHRHGRNFVKALVPTRFANWVALQSRPHQKQYLMPKHYTLEILWGVGIPSLTGH